MFLKSWWNSPPHTHPSFKEGLPISCQHTQIHRLSTHLSNVTQSHISTTEVRLLPHSTQSLEHERTWKAPAFLMFTRTVVRLLPHPEHSHKYHWRYTLEQWQGSCLTLNTVTSITTLMDTQKQQLSMEFLGRRNHVNSQHNHSNPGLDQPLKYLRILRREHVM